MAVPDPVAALIAFLRADSNVAALVGTRVFAPELPRNQTGNMPQACIVIRPAGGGFLGQAYEDYGDVRFDIDCYASDDRNPHSGWTLYLAVYEALKHMRRSVQADVLLHWAKSSSKGITLRDPDTDWAYTASSWQVFVSEVAAA